MEPLQSKHLAPLLSLLLFLVSVQSSLAQNFQWADGVGSAATTNEGGLAVASDDNGNVYVTGAFQNTVTFGSFNLTSAAGTDIFVVKYDQDGVVQWAIRAGGTWQNSTLESGYGIAFYDDGGNGVVYVTGQYVANVANPADFGAISLPGQSTILGETQVFIAAVDANLATMNWVGAMTSANTARVRGIAVDPIDGKVFFGGSHFGDLAVVDEVASPTIITNNTSTEDPWAGGFSAAGDFISGFTVEGTSEFDIIEDMAFHHDSNSSTDFLYVTGSFQSPDLNWMGAGILSAQGSDDAFISKVDLGTVMPVWAASAGGGSSDIAKGITVDSNGELYFTGYTDGAMSFFDAAATPGFTTPSAGNRQLFIAKYAENGDPIWSNTAGGGMADEGQDVILDYDDESPWVVGFGQGMVDFGADPEGSSVAQAADGVDVVLGHYDPGTGDILEAFVEGDAGDQQGFGMATNTFRDIFITGTYSGDGQFGTAVLPTSLGLDVFTTKLIPNSFINAFQNFTGIRAGESVWADIDIDGDLDVLVQGFNGATEITQLLENTDGTSFSDLAVGLPGIRLGDVQLVDVDNDGDLDIFITGQDVSSLPYTSIWVNNSDGTFSETDFGFSNYSGADADWGDYDNDGDMDLIIAGFEDAAGGAATFVYRNDLGSFGFFGIGLANTEPAVAWGDYDADGDLDLFVSGRTSGRPGESVILRNDAGNFIDIGAGLTGLFGGDAHWGDFDNDGDLDLLASGDDGTNLITVIFQNDGGDSFTEIDQGFIGVTLGSSTWGNYDGDGDLDVLISGIDDQGDVNTVLYTGSDDEFNVAPENAPSGLSSMVSGNQVTLSFDGSGVTDDFTQYPGFTYSLYVGTVSGGSDIVAPMSNTATGVREVAARGNMDHNESWTLTLPDGTYFWGVQAVDGAFAGSSFATEQTFTIGGADPDISISPTSMTETLAEGENSTQTFTIDNLGEGDLNWDFDSHITGGSAIQFDGVADFGVDVAHEGQLNFSGQLTIEMWVKPNSFTFNGHLLKGLDYIVTVDDVDGSLGFDPAQDPQTADQVLTLNQWNHIAVTIQSDNTLQMYVDGTLVHNSLYTPTSVGDPNGITIGSGSGFPFDGIIDDVRIWDIAKSQDEIRDNMFRKLNGTEADLVGYWPFDEGTGTTTADLTANANVGTLTDVTSVTWVSTSDRPFSPSWLSSSEFSGTVTPSGSQNIDVTFDAVSLTEGSYPTQIILNSNDPDESKILLPVSLTVTAGGTTATDPTDSLALVALYNSTNGDSWNDNTGWLTGPVSSWFGITVDPNSGRVTRIEMVQNNLDGPLPTELKDLTALEILKLSTNNVTGTIPAFLGTLSFLTDIYLASNAMTGSIPPDLTQLSNLQILDLGSNQLSGSIPTNIGDLTNLEQLTLGSNSLSGEIPASLWNLTNLTQLRVCCNALSGSIPSEIGNLTQLTLLVLGQNQFSEGVPAQLTSLSTLEQIFTGNNDFDFLPDFSGLSNLTALFAHNNRLTFEDLIPNQSVTGFTYDPQKDFGTTSTANKNEGETATIDLNVDNNVTDNDYIWFRDGSQISGTGTVNSITLSSLSSGDNGEYTAQMSNPAYPGFTISSVPQYVTVSCLSSPVGSSVGTRVTLEMNGTTAGGSHPCHIHMNSAASGGSIVLTFNPVDGTSGQSITTVDRFDNGTLVTFQELLNYDGHVVVHVSGTGVGATVAKGDIGSNGALSGPPYLYTLDEANASGVSGTVLFESGGNEDNDSKIDHVVLGDIDNNTAGATCQTYSDFTPLSTDLGPGESAAITVTLGTCGGDFPKYGKVYVDWDLDGVFSESEAAASSPNFIDGTGDFQGTVTVPANAKIGTSAKMRVVCWESAFTGANTPLYSEDFESVTEPDLPAL